MLGSKTRRQGSYLIGDCIGRGAFGSVHSGLNLDTGEFLAIKLVKMSNKRSDASVYIMVCSTAAKPAA